MLHCRLNVKGNAVIAADCNADAERNQLFSFGVKRFWRERSLASAPLQRQNPELSANHAWLELNRGDVPPALSRSGPCYPPKADIRAGPSYVRRPSSGSFATLAAIRLTSSFVSTFGAERRPLPLVAANGYLLATSQMSNWRYPNVR